MDYIIEKNKLEVAGSFDVVVAGGGIAGVSAALAAKRYGAKVLLVEKTVSLGGLGTIGLINYYEPLCDGHGRKIISGIAEELLYASILYGYNTLPSNWLKSDKKSAQMPSDSKKYRYATLYSPEAFILALDELMESEGIKILFDTWVTKPIISNGKCSHIVVENKSGRAVYASNVFIDTTGDLDLLSRSGAEIIEGQNWLTFSYKYTDYDSVKYAYENKNAYKAIKSRTLGCTFKGKTIDGQGQLDRKFFGIEAREVTAFITEGRKMALAKLKEKKTDEIITTLPVMAQFRTTRRLKGLFELKEEHSNAHFEDSIGCICDFTKNGPVYEVPYRTLISENIENIITAGRTISAAGHAWDVTRVIPSASLTGQAAGTAAAIAAHNGSALKDVDINLLQKVLSENGVMIHDIRYMHPKKSDFIER